MAAGPGPPVADPGGPERTRPLQLGARIGLGSRVLGGVASDGPGGASAGTLRLLPRRRSRPRAAGQGERNRPHQGALARRGILAVPSRHGCAVPVVSRCRALSSASHHPVPRPPFHSPPFPFPIPPLLPPTRQEDTSDIQKWPTDSEKQWWPDTRSARRGPPSSGSSGRRFA